MSVPHGRERRRSIGSRLVILIPALWLAVFFFVPFLIVLKLSLSQSAVAQPPYLPVLDLSAGWPGMRDFVSALSFENYALLASDSLYVTSYLRSLFIAATSTLLLLLIGYPIAYGMARAPRRAQHILVAAIVLPFLTAFLIRIYAWINILQREGLLNDALLALGVIGEPLVWLSTDTAIYIGIVYSYLPFMVLPLYASLEKMDETLLEAAADPSAFDVVISDLTMPVMTGAQLALEMRRVRANVPVILSTGYLDRLDPDTARALHARELLIKPYTTEDLATAVRRALADFAA